MNILVAGQRVVTALDLIDAAGLSPATDVEPRTAQLAAERDALTDFLGDLVAAADPDSDVDAEDIAYYEQLLRRLPSPFRSRDLARRPKARKAVAA